MDLMAGLLDGPRARRAFLLRSVLAPPWSIRLADEAPLSVVVVVSGHAWLMPDGSSPVRVEAGDLAVFRGPDHYTVADAVTTPPQALIHPDQTCTAIDGGELHWQSGSGVRTWGNVAGPVTEQHTVLLTGSYLARGEVSQRLLAALPPLVVVPRTEVDQTLVGLLISEAQQQRPGQEAVLDRLLDVVLVASLRAWFSRSGARTPGWYAAQSDPAIGPVLRLIQHHPERPWTLTELARAAGLSRAGLARRFTSLVGEPPITFLTGWRLALARTC